MRIVKLGDVLVAYVIGRRAAVAGRDPTCFRLPLWAVVDRPADVSGTGEGEAGERLEAPRRARAEPCTCDPCRFCKAGDGP